MKTVLVVDDNPIYRRLFSAKLEKDFHIIEANDADAALKIINAFKPDAVVLDILMPGSMDGFELCQYMKSVSSLKDIYVVLATSSWETLVDHSGRNKSDAFFIKPFNVSELLELLKEHLYGQAAFSKEVA